MGKIHTLARESSSGIYFSLCHEVESAPKRKCPFACDVNGQLQSVPEDIYDSFILREIAAQPEQFKMAEVIGNVLGKYQLGIGDVWVSNRIDAMIDNGMLEVVQNAPKRDLSYRRILRKRIK